MGRETLVAELQELDNVSSAETFGSGVTYYVTGHDRKAQEVLYKHGYSVVDVNASANGEVYIFALGGKDAEFHLGRERNL